MFFPRSPYPFWEFIGMAIRRYSAPPPVSTPSEEKLVFNEASTNQIRIGFVGDICPLKHRTVVLADGILDYFKDCDLMIGNFEGVLTDEPNRMFRHIVTPKMFDLLDTIKPIRQWALSIANNHAMDYGSDALYRTLNEFDSRGINWYGTAEKPTTTVTQDISVTGWTWWINGQTDLISEQDPGVPLHDGFHIATPHWGYEHEREPRATQRAKVPTRYDLIAGHHSHLPQPLEQLDNGIPVAWSLGNFLTAKTLPVLGEGALLKVVINRPDGKKPELQSVQYSAIILDRDDPDFCRVSFR